MSPRRIVVLGVMTASPYAGMAWMHMQIAVGLRRLGHDVYYFETSAGWPYDPLRGAEVNDSDYALPYLARVADSFGLGDRWAYRRSYGDKRWLGPVRSGAEALLKGADAVLNVAAATRLAEENLEAARLVYVGTDPGIHEVAFANGDEFVRSLIDEHHDVVTYGENIGNGVCPLPPLPRMRATMRQPVLLDLWASGPPARRTFTTVANWNTVGRDVEWQGETYSWSKHHEFVKFLELPRLTGVPVELATSLVRVTPEAQAAFESNGWRLVDAHGMTLGVWPYRDYVRSSRGEFTVAKEQNIRLRTGWFSERSACYLAAGRPVVTQDTGFGTVLPTGEGLFACQTLDDAVAAIEAIESDYRRHSRAARDIAEEYFRAETVLARLLEDLGV